MSHNVITRAGCCVDDSRMRPYNAKTKTYTSVDWQAKDKSFEEIENSLSSSTGNKEHVIVEKTPISNQGQAGTCVANAWCDAMEILDGLVGNDVVEQLSRRFLYWCARAYTNDTHHDDGTYLRSAAHQLKHIGIFEEKYFEYSDKPEFLVSSSKLSKPSLDHYTIASNNKLSNFYRIDSSTREKKLSQLETAIRSNHPVVFSTLINKGFQNIGNEDVVIGPPSKGDVILGSHAMIITGVGYDGPNRWWLIRNSWSKYWGNNGHVKINDDYMSQLRDAWVGTKIKEII